jgi:hypothetical protein
MVDVTAADYAGSLAINDLQGTGGGSNGNDDEDMQEQEPPAMGEPSDWDDMWDPEEQQHRLNELLRGQDDDDEDAFV